MIWHNSTAEAVLKELDVDQKTGLANGIADERLNNYGKNVITKSEKPNFLKRFLSQLSSKVVVTLIIIAMVSFIISLINKEANSFSALLIIAIVVVNALISAYQIYTSDNRLDEIKNFTNPTASVLRDGILKRINSNDVAVGDIIILEEGDYVPADARIIESNEFRCNEVSISGSEVPVEKNADVLLEDITPIEKRCNMIYNGCTVAHGNAKAVVVATGMDTELGRITTILEQTGDAKLPLQTQLEGHTLLSWTTFAQHLVFQPYSLR